MGVRVGVGVGLVPVDTVDENEIVGDGEGPASVVKAVPGRVHEAGAAAVFAHAAAKRPTWIWGTCRASVPASIKEIT